MTLIKTLSSLTLLAGFLVAPAALADKRDRDDDRRGRHHHGEVHAHGSSCHHGPMPQPPRAAHGRYELQTVNVWVPGQREQVWVPQECEYKRRRNRPRCTGGYYEQQWVPGHYAQQQQWVWVAEHAPVVYPPAPPPGRGGWSVQVSAHR